MRKKIYCPRCGQTSRRCKRIVKEGDLCCTCMNAHKCDWCH